MIRTYYTLGTVKSYFDIMRESTANPIINLRAKFLGKSKQKNRVLPETWLGYKPGRTYQLVIAAPLNSVYRLMIWKDRDTHPSKEGPGLYSYVDIADFQLDWDIPEKYLTLIKLTI